MFIKKQTSQVIHDYDKPIVETTAGKLRGIICDGTFIFRGVRYATARRYHRAVPEQPWTGVREASFFGYMPPELKRYSIGGEYVCRHVYLPQDEDCLSVNIWTQSLDPGARKPVLFWMHGGGYDEGSGINHYAYDGEEMSKFGDVVVVSVNHRLNVLGYLDLSAYGEEYALTANLGQDDLVCALRWVRDNIAAFGGDPDNVTIFGQSGGGGKTITLMQMPSADGLYHRAIVMSGVFGRQDRPFGPEDGGKTARQLAARILEKLGLTAGTVKEIETVPYYDLAMAANAARDELSAETGCRIGFRPIPDGRYYAGDPFDVGFREETKHIPLMIGSVLAEFIPPVEDPRAQAQSRYHWDASLTDELLRAKFGDRTPALVQAYAEAYPERIPADLLFVDSRVRRASVEFARLRAGASDAGTYNYLFCHELPDMGGSIPGHNCDIPYAFHNAQYLEPFYLPGATEHVQDTLCGAFVNFARTGDPNGAHVPHWEPVTADNGATMVIDTRSETRFAHDRALMELLPPEMPPFMRAQKK
ncbi:MAG: carboxylesterase/lipase family protein [Aristaeellaceae bacterium]